MEKNYNDSEKLLASPQPPIPTRDGTTMYHDTYVCNGSICIYILTLQIEHQCIDISMHCINH